MSGFSQALWSSVKAWVAGAFCVLASILFLEDPSIQIEPADFLLPLVLSGLVVTTLAWQWRLFGNPSRYFLAHFLLFVAVAMMIARVAQPPKDSDYTLLGSVINVVAWAGEIIGILPDWMQTFMRSPSMALVFFALLIALTVKWPYSAGALGLFTFFGIIIAITSPGFVGLGSFVLGLICLAIGLFLLYRPPDTYQFWKRLTDVWSGKMLIRGDFEVTFSLFRRALRQGYELRDAQVVSEVRGILGQSVHEDEVRSVARRVIKRLLDDGLVELKQSGQGTIVCVDTRLVESEMDVWATTALVPKTIFIGLIAVLWIISPIDSLPDAIPILGVLDDAVVASIGFSFIKDAIRSKRARSTKVLDPLSNSTYSSSSGSTESVNSLVR